MFQIAKLETRRIKKLKNRHLGQSCYIVGDGVSLKWFNLGAFQPCITFSLGYLPFHIDASKMNLTYINLGDSWWFYPFTVLPKSYVPASFLNYKRIWRNRLNVILKNYIKLNPQKTYFSHMTNYPYTRSKNTYHYFYKFNDSNFSFENECRINQLDPLAGSLIRTLSLAIYMGFKQITLLGCDYTHKISRSHHWYEKGEGLIYSQPNYQRKFLEIARRYAEI